MPDLSRPSGLLFICCFVFPFLLKAQAPAADFRFAPDTADRTALIVQMEKEYRAQRDQLLKQDLTGKQTEYLTNAYRERLKIGKQLLESKDVILSGPVYAFVDSIFNAILRSNAGLDPNSKLVLYRDLQFNAFTLGDNVVFMNIGLLHRCRNRQQVALVLAHELAHNAADHTQESLLDQVRIATDDDLNKRIKDIARRDAGQVTALNDLLVPVIYDAREQSRMNEHEADSLGLIYFLSAGFPPIEAMSLFAVMEDAGHMRDADPLDILGVFGITAGSPAAVSYARYSRTSSLGAFSGKEEDNPYLRSHPYETDRETAVLRQLGVEEIDTLVPQDEAYLHLRYQVEGEMVYSAIGHGDYSNGVYYALRMQQLYPGDTFSRAAIAYQLEMLAFYKINRSAGRHIALQNPKNDEIPDRINYFLQQLTPEDCRRISQAWSSGLPASYNTPLTEMTDLAGDYLDKKYEQFRLRYEVLFEELGQTLLTDPLDDLAEDYTVKTKQTIKIK